MAVTIRQIAERAGVSRGTVDRVLNDRARVKPEVRERVLAIAREMDYVPHAAGKALAYSKKPAIFGVIMPPREIRFFDEIRSGIDAASGELTNLGISLIYRYVDNQNPEEPAAAIRELVENEGVSGILFSAMDDVLIRQAIDEAVECGVPVVTFNSDVEGCKRTCFVGQDLYKSGKVAAGLMQRIVRPEASVLIVTGNLKFHAHRSRVKAFAEGLAEGSGHLTVAQVIEGYDRYADTFAKLEQALLDHPQIEGIYMATGSVSACVDVVRRCGRAGTLRIVCNDLLPEVRQGMHDRIIDFTIVQNPKQQGYRSLRILYDLIFAGKKPEQELYYTETVICIPESL